MVFTVEMNARSKGTTRVSASKVCACASVVVDVVDDGRGRFRGSPPKQFDAGCRYGADLNVILAEETSGRKRAEVLRLGGKRGVGGR